MNHASQRFVIRGDGDRARWVCFSGRSKRTCHDVGACFAGAKVPDLALPFSLRLRFPSGLSHFHPDTGFRPVESAPRLGTPQGPTPNTPSVALTVRTEDLLTPTAPLCKPDPQTQGRASGGVPAALVCSGGVWYPPDRGRCPGHRACRAASHSARLVLSTAFVEDDSDGMGCVIHRP